MRTGLTLCLGLMARGGRSRRDLLLEHLALRHQLALCERRPRVTITDRVAAIPILAGLQHGYERAAA